MNAPTKTATILDLDALLDESLDSIPDLPEYINPPDGNYRLRCKEAKIESYKGKPKNGEPAKEGTRIRMTTEVVATVELAKDGAPVADGTLFSETFQGTEEGLGFFKQRAIKVLNVADVKGVPLREILSSLEGSEYDAKITTKVSKVGDSTYENIQVRVIPPLQG